MKIISEGTYVLKYGSFTRFVTSLQNLGGLHAMPGDEGAQEAPHDRGGSVVLPGRARTRLAHGGKFVACSFFGGRFKSNIKLRVTA